VIQRGDVFRVSLDPIRGSEIGKTRPSVVVQNDLANRSSNTVTIIPISSQTSRIFSFQVAIPAGEGGLSQTSKALCEQIRTVAKERLVEKLGHLTPERMEQIRNALDRHLWF
jgi:mRNA interferase MazF